MRVISREEWEDSGGFFFTNDMLGKSHYYEKGEEVKPPWRATPEELEDAHLEYAAKRERETETDDGS